MAPPTYVTLASKTDAWDFQLSVTYQEIEASSERKRPNHVLAPFPEFLESRYIEL